MITECFYSHVVSRDTKSEKEWKRIAEHEGWDYERALKHEFLILEYKKITSDWGLDLFFGV